MHIAFSALTVFCLCLFGLYDLLLSCVYYIQGRRYTNTSGDSKPARSFRPVTTCCRRKCYCMSVEDQKTLYDDYRNLGDYNLQSMYLSGCMSKTEPKRRVTVPSSHKQRAVWHYKVRLAGKSLIVCQLFLRNVLRESPKRLEILQSKILAGNGLLDERGKHTNRPNQIDFEAWTLLDVYCESIPHAPSHYSHSKTDRQYFLNPDLNMKKVFDGFIDYYGAVTGNDIVIAFNTFERHFVTSMPYGFKLPRTDVCNMCFEHESKCSATDEMLFKLHKKKVEGYKHIKALILEKAKAEQHGVLVLEFDYAQNLPLPKIPVTDQFYKRLLWMYVFNVHVYERNTSYMYHFVEGMSKKGANSVCSFLLDVIRLERGQAKEIFLFSDACSGQNRNWTMVTFLMTVAAEFGVTITHVFPVRGHSYCQCDRNFALFSRKVKKTERVETVHDYVQIVEKCKEKHPFIVKEGAVKDFDSHLKQRFKKPRDLQVSKAVIIKYHPNGMLEVHPNYAQLTPSTFNICKKTRTDSILTTAPDAEHSTVSAAKVNDVLSLVRYVSVPNRKFYTDYFGLQKSAAASKPAEDSEPDASDLEY